MKINWKLRFKNKAVLTALFACTVTFIYQIFGIFDITVSISENEIIQIISVFLNFLAALGILIDPTTMGMNDSESALTYQEPK
ncbi:phage holin [Sinanaerobacter sp. ZZT-01]|uniref:phage holin n=1 Tax=Sinanaerobacter sp. ZZT-01 TaxID=3111540 RepID=UPI002D771C24|nr:phage holin [Sinanaerobacter sp. ZZT-01]WRR94074.1 phage holin [Sinanaerobacter sp. ZZT-01]